jgi:peptide chain release factor 3
MSTAVTPADQARLRREIERRRTFAIIAHPDAGKTTLTEKLLLYGGAIQLAGAVKARRSKFAASDWMELERQRGISVTTSVMSFPYRDHHLNLLDTPGHQDFSEDTYRTLAAVDSAVMLIDSGKGVEAQTKKLFKVCRRRGIPIFVFFNKLDRWGRPPLELVDEIERVLGIRTSCVNWPVGMGSEFRGVFDRITQRFHVYEGAAKGAKRLVVRQGRLDDPELAELIGSELLDKLREELEILDLAGDPLDKERVLSGELAPAFFGSALTNFGVDDFLDALLDLAPGPRPGRTAQGVVAPDDPRFTGFVFKIQANMNPAHRDRIAFVRVISGRYEPGLEVSLEPRGKAVRLAEPRQFMAREAKAMAEAFPGDVVGLFDPGTYRIGDTLTVDPKIAFEGIPLFPAEHFAVARVPDASFRKSFQKGILQLAEEGAIQVFRHPERGDRDPIVGAVGKLQFDVLAFRLQSEYGVPVKLDPAPFTAARWVTGDPVAIKALGEGVGWTLTLDRDDRPVVLLRNSYWVDELPRKHPQLGFHEVSGSAPAGV